MKSPYCYLNGTIAPRHRLGISLTDLGVLRGFGIFDFMRTHDGKPFLMKKYIARFERSAKRIGLSMPIPAGEIEDVIHALLKKNNFRNASIRLVLTGGSSSDGFSLSSKPTFFILVNKAKNHPASFYTRGVALKTHNYTRLLPDIKTLNYIELMRHQKELTRKGILELLYVHDGTVLESSSSNFFVVKNNVLITPKSGILKGVTRNFLIKIVRKHYRVFERKISVSELKTVDEAFITASNKGIMPVTKIDGYKVGNGKVGPVVTDLIALYKDSIRNSLLTS